MTWWMWYLIIGFVIACITVYYGGKTAEISDDAITVTFAFILGIILWPLLFAAVIGYYFYKLGKLAQFKKPDGEPTASVQANRK